MAVNPPKLSEFFQLGTEWSRSKTGHPINYWFAGGFASSVVTKYARGKQAPFTPIFTAQGGRRLRDFVESSSNVLVASQRVVDVLVAEKFTGWKNFQAFLYRGYGRPIKDQGYYWFGITGRCGKQGNSSPAEVRLAMKSWDGSDFFFFKDSITPYVTARVVDALKKAKLTGWEATPLKKVQAEGPSI